MLVRLVHEIMYHAPDIAKLRPSSAGFYTCFECGVGEGAEGATLVVYADEKGFGRIAVVAVEVDGDVNIDDISAFRGASGLVCTSRIMKGSTRWVVHEL